MESWHITGTRSDMPLCMAIAMRSCEVIFLPDSPEVKYVLQKAFCFYYVLECITDIKILDYFQIVKYYAIRLIHKYFCYCKDARTQRN